MGGEEGRGLILATKCIPLSVSGAGIKSEIIYNIERKKEKKSFGKISNRGIFLQEFLNFDALGEIFFFNF